MTRLPVVDPRRIVHASQRFRCARLSAEISGAVCVGRQDVAAAAVVHLGGSDRTPVPTTYASCYRCDQGRAVAAALARGETP